ncbi:hypothetical protein LGM89_24285 [Burkholderia sp. AU31624]|uniref:hypothetical protein n=1 Tax=unclassified Burkholderia TaxID=2613784 RepID=UPI0015C5FBBC|nr:MULTISPECIES: hypothetical protein [unclassified Burkholderia]MCA8064076.1 hypothetical protein [Burkholderia sp. AU38729]MCA8256394.1 hypothetical protein [Burkholderia sp. AU31624]
MTSNVPDKRTANRVSVSFCVVAAIAYEKSAERAAEVVAALEKRGRQAVACFPSGMDAVTRALCAGTVKTRDS